MAKPNKLQCNLSNAVLLGQNFSDCFTLVAALPGFSLIFITRKLLYVNTKCVPNVNGCYCYIGYELNVILFIWTSGCNSLSMYVYVIAISRYEHDIQVIAQDRGEAEVTGDDLDIMRVNRDITNFYPMQIDFQLVDLIGNN